jgi:biopolymer transport protein ExbD
MPLPRSLRTGFYVVPCAIAWVLVLRYFSRFFDSPYFGLFETLKQTSYLPLLIFLTAILLRLVNQRSKKAPSRKWVGIAATLGGTILAATWAGWTATRTWLPVDIPVSLSPGHVRTGEFKINMRSKYWVYVLADKKPGIPCLLGFRLDECNSTPSALRVSWSLSDAGKNVADGGSDIEQRTLEFSDRVGRGLGFFWVAEGKHYVLDVHVLSDGSRLDVAHPRVRIEELGGRYWEYLSWTVFVLFSGMLSVVFGLTLWFRALANAESSALSSPPTPVAAKPQSAPSGQMWIGIILFLIGLAVFIGVHRWMTTRKFVAVNMPISLGRGHTRTGPFQINLKDFYGVKIDTGWRAYFDPNCPSYGQLKAGWVLYRDGHAFAVWNESTPHTDLGGFDSEKGTYDLDLEVLSDTRCLDPGNPRLLVYTSKSNYEDYTAPILWASALSVALGASLLALGCIAYFGERRPRTTRITDSESIGQHFQWAQKLPLRKQFLTLPAFALIAGTSLFVPVIVFSLLSPLPARGLFVALMKSLPLAANNDLLTEPIVVHVVDAGPGVASSVYVNSKATSWEKLGTALRDELKIRPDWVVYVEADENVPWGSAVNVIDVAKGLHAKVVLLTSKPSHGTGHTRVTDDLSVPSPPKSSASPPARP